MPSRGVGRDSASTGERRPYQGRTSAGGSAGERKPYERREGGSGQRPDRGERKPFQRRDGGSSERRPYQGRDNAGGSAGERKPYERREGGAGQRPDRGERTPYERREGGSSERRPYQGRDSAGGSAGERKPYERREGGAGLRPDRGERKPFERREGGSGQRPDRGERKPYERREGGAGQRPDRGERKPFERREGGSSERRPYQGRDENAGEWKKYELHGSESRPIRRDADASGSRNDDPELPDSIRAKDLEKSAYAELKGLSKENAERVARHLVASAVALEADPELSHKHALAAARTAGRVAVVRETVAITAYAIGDYTLALRELRTYRRLSGNNDHIALIVDSERGLERPEKALEEGRAVDRSTIPVDSRVALAIAMSGARLDLGQPELALGELEIPELDPARAFEYSPSLFHAYAEVLEELGRAVDSAEWRHRAEVAQAALDEMYSEDVMDVYEEINDLVVAVESAAAGEPHD